MSKTDPLKRIAAALERLSPPPAQMPDFDAASGFIWSTEPDRLEPVERIDRVHISLLVGVEQVRDILLDNTNRFAQGLPANNALLWGARGMGKSSLVKAVHADVSELYGDLKIVEIQHEDMVSIGRCLDLLRQSDKRFILFCDDLSFTQDDAHYKSLKTLLDGGINGRPDNVLLYASSNRRHLVAQDMIDNEAATAIDPGEAIEEKVSLSDRFGLWLGVHSCTQAQYLEMIRLYCDSYGIAVDDDTLEAEALEWQVTRGSRSGRVAWQFFVDLAGRNGLTLD